MAKEKTSKIQQITQTKNRHKNSVFSQSMFMNNATAHEQNTNDYNYMQVNLQDIIIENPQPEYLQAFFNSVKERIVYPIFLSYDFEWKEKAGVRFRAKTGKYRIVDGEKRVAIYNQLYNDAVEKQDTEAMQKYSQVPALVLPLETPEEDIEKIREETNANKMEGPKQVVKDITETANEDITYCYKYEMEEIPLDKLVERDNKYRILPSEVDELEKSIYNAGLMQPIIVYPTIDMRTLEVRYEIQAGHKRTRAIRQLIQHAKEGWYPLSTELIIETYKTVPALIIPMGATPEQIEKVYNDTNLLSRHMTSEDVFTHISYFSELPSRPTTKEEYIHFKEAGYQIKDLADIVQTKFKNLGFSDWKTSKASIFLNVYYYGSDLAMKAFENLKEYNLKQKELNWIVTKNKDYVDRVKQDEIIEKTKENKAYIINLMSEKVNKKTMDFKSLDLAIRRQKVNMDKLTKTTTDVNEVVAYKDMQQTMNTINEIEALLDSLKAKLKSIPVAEEE